MGESLYILGGLFELDEPLMIGEFPCGGIDLRCYGKFAHFASLLGKGLGKGFFYLLGDDMFAKGRYKVLDTPCYHDAIGLKGGEHHRIAHVVAP